MLKGRSDTGGTLEWHGGSCPLLPWGWDLGLRGHLEGPKPSPLELWRVPIPPSQHIHESLSPTRPQLHPWIHAQLCPQGFPLQRNHKILSGFRSLGAQSSAGFGFWELSLPRGFRTLKPQGSGLPARVSGEIIPRISLTIPPNLCKCTGSLKFRYFLYPALLLLDSSRDSWIWGKLQRRFAGYSIKWEAGGS